MVARIETNRKQKAAAKFYGITEDLNPAWLFFVCLPLGIVSGNLITLLTGGDIELAVNLYVWIVGGILATILHVLKAHGRKYSVPDTHQANKATEIYNGLLPENKITAAPLVNKIYDLSVMTDTFARDPIYQRLNLIYDIEAQDREQRKQMIESDNFDLELARSTVAAWKEMQPKTRAIETKPVVDSVIEAQPVCAYCGNGKHWTSECSKANYVRTYERTNGYVIKYSQDDDCWEYIYND